MKIVIIVRRWPSPLGVMLLGSVGGSLCLADWEDSGKRQLTDRRLRRFFGAEYQEGTSPVIERAIEQLGEYFRKERREFSLPLLMAGTDFQRSVWRGLLRIPYGDTITYAEQARRLGKPTAVRAVAAANGCNPIAVIVPCHRVVGAGGSLTGYSAGIYIKERLLGMEAF